MLNYLKNIVYFEYEAKKTDVYNFNLKTIEVYDHNYYIVEPLNNEHQKNLLNCFNNNYSFNIILDLTCNKLIIDIKKDNKLLKTVFINRSLHNILNDLINLDLNKNFNYNLNVLY